MRHPRLRRLARWTGRGVGGVVVVLALLFLWSLLSPRPGAALIKYVFERDGAATQAALDEGAPLDVTVLEDEQYGRDGLALDVYLPPGSRPGERHPVVVWTHGGAWLSGHKDDARGYFRRLAERGYTVVAPEYSLAPGAQFPSQVHQLNDAHATLLERADDFHADPDRVFLAGDSAGSHLSAVLGTAVTSPSYAAEIGVKPALRPGQLRGVVLSCGIYDVRKLGEAGRDLDLPRLVGWGDTTAVWAVSGTKNSDDPVIRRMSPLFHATGDFPATFVTGGNADPLTDSQSKPLAARLGQLGVDVTTLFFPTGHRPALPHEYQFTLDADGRHAFEQIVEFLDRRSG